MIKIPEYILNLIPYKAGKSIEELAREKDLKKIVKLASNENPLGISPKAAEAIKSNIEHLNRYPDPHAYDLITKLSKIYNIPSNQIVAASGSDALMQYIMIALVENDEEIICSEGSFLGWYVNANKLKKCLIKVPLNDLQYDLFAFQSRITSATKMIYLANPNNPTGDMFSVDEFNDFLESIPKSIIVVYDEAYTTYAEDNINYPNGMNYLRDNIIILRTLSKNYGLAGLRIGYAIGPEKIISQIYKVKLPFEPSTLAAAAAVAALDDYDFIKKTKEQNAKSLKYLETEIDLLGILHTGTYTNFFLMLFTSENEAYDFVMDCLEKGLILRHTKSYGINNGVRINSGTDEETEFAVNVIKQVYQKQKIIIK